MCARRSRPPARGRPLRALRGFRRARGAAGLAVGDTADLVAVQGRNPSEAVLEHHKRELVVKNGRVVARDGLPV
jgi:cytosine/adenosine deaminase-related metal-dependent hydrolase